MSKYIATSRYSVKEMPLIYAVVCTLLSFSSVADRLEDEIHVVAQMPLLESSSSALIAHTFIAADLDKSKSTDLTDYLYLNTPSVTINSAQNNPLQPDLHYRGFSASPLLGLSQGLVVYQNGARINEPLGDSVNWDLVSDTAINQVSLLAGGNPLFGLNALGGAISLDMKNGFTYQGREVEIQGGSWGRIKSTLQTGGNDGVWGYYANVSFFQEDGWRDLSNSDALNLYAGASYRGATFETDLGVFYADTDLIGNGSSPKGLLEISRKAIFTAPDITENEMKMFTLESKQYVGGAFTITSNMFYRDVSTASFNGDSSDYSVCELGDGEKLIDGFDEDKLELIGLDDDVCEDNTLKASSVSQLEDSLNAYVSDVEAHFNLEDLTNKLYGGTAFSDEAINNISSRDQKSYGVDLQSLYMHKLLQHDSTLFTGLGYHRGTSKFDSKTELATLDPISRSTRGRGLGTFLTDEETKVSTSSTTWSAYFLETLDYEDLFSISFGGRYNRTRVVLKDRTNVHPEIEGRHLFQRFNPTVSGVLRFNPGVDFYASYSESSRAPTPIELACNDDVFEIARTAASLRGDDPDDIDFECRLPNAFLADPPLEQVVSESIEVGTRGVFNLFNYQLSFFRTNSKNDIIFQTTGRGKGLFSNVDNTRRQGVESSIGGDFERLSWVASYSYIRATFEDNFIVLSPNHPLANSKGNISVARGDTIPGIPEHQFKFVSEIAITEKLTTALEFSIFSDQVLRGDESNQLSKLGGYSVTNLRLRYEASPELDFFARVSNIFDRDYENFGLIGEEPDEVISTLNNNSPIFLGSGAPRAVWVGVKLSF